LHLLLCKTPTAEDAATAGYRGESQTVYHTYLFDYDGDGDGDDGRPTIIEYSYFLHADSTAQMSVMKPVKYTNITQTHKNLNSNNNKSNIRVT
jgi:hypothetical protein